MGEEIAKFIWKSRLAILIGAFCGSIAGLNLSYYGAIYIIAFGVSLRFVRIVEPVVVIPDIDSKTESIKLIPLK